MRLYTVHEKSSSPTAAEEAVFVKEGFCWPALFFPLLWFLWHRMWLIALLYIVAVGALGALMAALGEPEPLTTFVFIGFTVLIGAEANDLRRRALAGRGYDKVALVAGADMNDAEQRFVYRSVPT